MPHSTLSTATDTEISIAKELIARRRTVAKIEIELARTHKALLATQEQLARLQLTVPSSTLKIPPATDTCHNFKEGDQVRILTNTKLHKFKGRIGTIVHTTKHTVSIKVADTRHTIIVKHKTSVSLV